MSILEKFNKMKSEKNRQRIEETAADLYQIRECAGELWLTFRGSLVCPCSMLKSEPVEAIVRMRELYVERNSE